MNYLIGCLQEHIQHGADNMLPVGYMGLTFRIDLATFQELNFRKILTRDAPIRHWPIIGRPLIGRLIADNTKIYLAVLFR